jgi:hypothetical protein
MQSKLLLCFLKPLFSYEGYLQYRLLVLYLTPPHPAPYDTLIEDCGYACPRTAQCQQVSDHLSVITFIHTRDYHQLSTSLNLPFHSFSLPISLSLSLLMFAFSFCLCLFLPVRISFYLTLLISFWPSIFFPRGIFNDAFTIVTI